jgi:hypothetical protein
MSEPDWMNLDQLPTVGIPQDVVEANPKYQALVASFRALDKKQQEFVRAMPAAQYVAAKALVMLKARGSTISERTIYRWLSDPKVKLAIDLHRELAGNFAGIDALSVMLRVVAWCDYCEEVVPVFKDGVEIGTQKRDPSNGLKALELLGKHTHALGKVEESTQRREGPGLVVVQIKGDVQEVNVTQQTANIIEEPK